MPTTLTDRIPLNLIEHFDALKRFGFEPGDFFQIPSTPFREKFIRQNAASLSTRLSDPLRYKLTSLAKRVRNPFGDLKLNYPLDFEVNQVIAKSIEGKNLRPWWRAKAVICLCHDVDNQAGFDFVPEMARMNLEHGIRSTFNFLTHDHYNVDFDLLRALAGHGFEIGCHGFTHDQGFAFRPKAVISEQLRQSWEKLKEFKPQGFRSPALSLSSDLFSSLGQRGFGYDSSLQIASPFYYSVRLPYPVYMEEFGLWEMPLMVQDDNYMRDTHCRDVEIFISLKRFVDDVRRLNGVFVLNLHPHNMAGRKELYNSILGMLKSAADVVFKPMNEVVDYVKNHTHNQ